MGCNYDEYTCSKAPKWVYATSYWTSLISGSLDIVGVDTDTVFDSLHYRTDNVFGVRPVVEISTSEFNNL